MCLCVWEREEQERRDPNILLSHSLHHKSYFSNCHPAVPAQREGGWNKDTKAMRKERKRQEERGVRAAGGWSEKMRQNGYHLIPQLLRPTTSLTARRPSRSHLPCLVLTQWGDPHLHQDHFRSTIHFCCARYVQSRSPGPAPPFVYTVPYTETDLHP